MVGLGDTVVTLTAEDEVGNESTCEVTVTVLDGIDPVAVCCMGITLQLDMNGQATLAPEGMDCGSIDNCGIASMTVEPSTFSCADIGDNLVTLTVADASGNTDACQATVIVEDIMPPVPVCQDITVYLDEDGESIVRPEDVDGGTTDNCSFSLTITPSVFDCMDLGENAVTLTATDASGHGHGAGGDVFVLVLVLGVFALAGKRTASVLRDLKPTLFPARHPKCG